MNEVHDGRSSGGLALAWRFRGALWRLTLAALVLIVVLQNLEPTRVDLFFWSLPSVPKLVLIVVSGLLGAVLYAAGSSWYRRGGREA